MKQKRPFPDLIKIGAVRSEELTPYALQLESNKTIHVYDAQIISFLKEVLDFKYQILLPSDGPFGTFLPDGNWTGMLGMLQREEVDIAVGVLSVSERRSRVADFSYPYHYTSVTFVTDKPRYPPNSYAIFYPFSLSVWVAIAVELIIVVLILCYLFKCKKNDPQGVLMNMYGCLLQIPVNLQFPRPSCTLLIFTWVFGTMFLACAYKGILLSFLTFPSPFGIQSIPELVAAVSEDTAFKCSTYKSSYIYPLFSHARDEPLRKIGECMNRTAVSVDESIEDFLRPTGYSKAFIGERSYLASLRRDYFISGDSFFGSMVAIAVGKTFCCKATLDQLIHEAAAVGLFQKIERKELFFKVLEETYEGIEHTSPIRKLSLDDLAAVFAILITGYLLASLALIVELLLHRNRRNFRR